MPGWTDDLQKQLDGLDSAELRRVLRPVDRCALYVERGGRRLLNLASNDYLGLAGHPHLVAAVCGAAAEYGVGSGASRLATGSHDAHAALEQRFAGFKHAETALLLPTGFMANLAVLAALARRGDLICLDKLNHASLIDAARSSGATVRTFPHLGYAKLERLLERSTADRKLIVTDAVFSMDGDLADLRALAALRDRFDAILVVDEAHATGVLGATGAGLAELQGVTDRIDVTISTGSKALGSLGGIVTGPRVVTEALVNTARSFIYTTAAPPTQVAALNAALDVIAGEPRRRDRLASLTSAVRTRLRQSDWRVPDAPTPIIPIVTGSAGSEIALADRLEARGILVPAIRPPTVPPNSARVRLSLRADMGDDDVDRLLDALGHAN